ncbi:MAG: class I SAM-dependent methyltransferase [Salinarimonadaceae bacterium]|nr:MAG: class I SAM-dependent methyltransferase [Salinarimonadaceae bacterium]
MTPLGREIARMIALDGPVTVERYMALCLSHPAHGYYMTRDPLGLEGDFVTAPEISQMFGELVGLWAAQVWLDIGAPSPFRLVEFGPGRGTLMADALRAVRAAPGFLEAVSVDLVETSPILTARQQATLAAATVPVRWLRDVSEVPDGPAIYLANEFFDALPIRQFVRAAGGWRERLVGLGGENGLAFGLAPDADPTITVSGREGATLEWQATGNAVMSDIARRIVSQGGAALAIDYGHLRSGLADTLQAIKNHAFTDVLAEPGEADVTAHVDFAQLGAAARAQGARVHGPTSQGAFLRAMGIDARAQALSTARPDRAAEIEAARMRLTGDGEEHMGALFKAIAVTAPDGPAPPGFDAVTG